MYKRENLSNIERVIKERRNERKGSIFVTRTSDRYVKNSISNEVIIMCLGVG